VVSENGRRALSDSGVRNRADTAVWRNFLLAITTGLALAFGIGLGREILLSHDARIQGDRCTGETCDEMQKEITERKRWSEWHVLNMTQIRGDIDDDILGVQERVEEVERRVERLDDEVWAGKRKPPLPDHYSPHGE